MQAEMHGDIDVGLNKNCLAVDRAFMHIGLAGLAWTDGRKGGRTSCWKARDRQLSRRVVRLSGHLQPNVSISNHLGNIICYPKDRGKKKN